MLADVHITGLAKAEDAAKEILEHISAIRKLLSDCNYSGIRISVDLQNEADSGN